MKTLTINIPDAQAQTTEPSDYPNAYIAIPPNGHTCTVTGLKHAVLYRLLTGDGAARQYVRVVNLKSPHASKGKTIYHVGDMLRYLDRLATQQSTGQKR